MKVKKIHFSSCLSCLFLPQALSFLSVASDAATPLSCTCCSLAFLFLTELLFVFCFVHLRFTFLLAQPLTLYYFFPEILTSVKVNYFSLFSSPFPQTCQYWSTCQFPYHDCSFCSSRALMGSKKVFDISEQPCQFK